MYELFFEEGNIHLYFRGETPSVSLFRATYNTYLYSNLIFYQDIPEGCAPFPPHSDKRQGFFPLW